MWEWHQNLNLVDSFKKHAKIGGSILVVMGIIGIIFPQLISITTVMLVASLMMFDAIALLWTVLLFKNKRYIYELTF